MHFVINKQRLCQTLKKLEVALPPKRRHLHEILYHLLLQVDGTGVTLIAKGFDMRLSIRLGEPVSISAYGVCEMGYTELVEALKAFPRAAELLVQETEQGVQITYDASVRLVRAHTQDSFYAPTTIPPEGITFEQQEYEGIGYAGRYRVLRMQTQRLMIRQGEFLAALGKVAFAAAGDDSRPMMMAIYTQLRDDELSLVASDGFVLAEHCVTIAGSGTWEHGVPILAKPLLQALQLLPTEAQVTLECSMRTKQLIQWNGSRVEDAEPLVECVLARLLTDQIEIELYPVRGPYPNFRHVVDQQTTTHATCETSALLAEVERLAPIAQAFRGSVRLTLEEQRIWMEVRPRAAQEGEPSPVPMTGAVHANVQGDEVSIALDPNYLLALLHATAAQEIVLGLMKSTKPALFRPGGEQTTYAVMALTDHY